MTCAIRFFFDPGSGTCLWAENDAARERFGYAISHWELPITENAKRFLQHLVAWFDTSIDWASPGDSDDYWSEEELRRFNEAASKGLLLLKQELPGPGFEFKDGHAKPFAAADGFAVR